jgi:hypothetical protein
MGSTSTVKTGNEKEQCCSEKPVYEISYNHISKIWLVCHECLQIECFSFDIKEKVKIKQ